MVQSTSRASPVFDGEIRGVISTDYINMEEGKKASTFSLPDHRMAELLSRSARFNENSLSDYRKKLYNETHTLQERRENNGHNKKGYACP